MADLSTEGTKGHKGTRPLLSPAVKAGGLTGDVLTVNAKPCGALPDVPDTTDPVLKAPPKAPQSFEFDALPPAGTVVMLHGQRYEMIGSEAFVRRSGEPATYSIWTSHCARCGGPFLARVLTPSKHGTRRCTPCRATERGRV